MEVRFVQETMKYCKLVFSEVFMVYGNYSYFIAVDYGSIRVLKIMRVCHVTGGVHVRSVHSTYV